MWLVFHARPFGKFTDKEQPQEKEASLNKSRFQFPQSKLEKKVIPSIFKDDFSSRTEPCIFISIATVLLDQSNKTSQVFPALKATSHLLPQFTVSQRSDSKISLEANSSCCYRSDT